MLAMLLFGGTLFFAVLISEFTKRSVLSTAVLFLFVGILAGEGILNLGFYNSESELAHTFAELALFSVLFTDGMRINFDQLRQIRFLPGRALLLGLPLTFALITGLGRVILDLSWLNAMLVAAVLSPTDPVFASAIVGRDEIPTRIKRLLNVESGLNDGLVLPLVIVLIASARQESFAIDTLLVELALGFVIGIVVPWIAVQIQKRESFTTGIGIYEPFDAFAIELFLFGLANTLHANPFIAAFTAGIMIATISPTLRDQYHVFGERVTELLKLATLIIFGALISPDLMTALTLPRVAFMLLILFLARPLAIGLSLLRSTLNWREQAVIAWFGPRGFASVVYGLLILRKGIPESNRLFNIIGLVVFGSIIAHSSTDVLVAQWIRRDESQDDTGDSP